MAPVRIDDGGSEGDECKAADVLTVRRKEEPRNECFKNSLLNIALDSAETHEENEGGDISLSVCTCVWVFVFAQESWQ